MSAKPERVKASSTAANLWGFSSNETIADSRKTKMKRCSWTKGASDLQRQRVLEDRQAGRQAGTHADRPTDRQADRQTGRLVTHLPKTSMTTSTSSRICSTTAQYQYRVLMHQYNTEIMSLTTWTSDSFSLLCHTPQFGAAPCITLSL
jgi:hypothetical protein